MNIGWRTKYILALSEDFLIHRWKLSGTMGLAHGFHFHKNKAEIPSLWAFRFFRFYSLFQALSVPRSVMPLQRHSPQKNDLIYDM